MKQVILHLILFWTALPSYGQSTRVDEINDEVKAIDSDVTIKIKEFDAAEVYGHTSDGGGKIKIYQKDGQIRKIEEQTGLSFGRITTIIYLVDSKPILITDREENFKRNDDGSFNYSSLREVFEARLYMADGELVDAIKKGARAMSEGTDEVGEYLSKIEMAEGLIHE